MSANYVGDIPFDFGEERHVKTIVKPVCDSELSFIIRSARYELIIKGEIEDRGECAIFGHELDVFLAPQSRGVYDLRILYEIADETWVDLIKIKVT